MGRERARVTPRGGRRSRPEARPVPPFLQLRLLPLERVEDAPLPIEERFRRFHGANPQVYRLVVRVARELLSTGLNRGSMNMIFERLRWLYTVQTQGSHYRLNNSYRAFYARLVMEREPDLDAFFTVREQRPSSLAPQD